MDADLSVLRIPPHSVEAEQAVLGGVMLSRDAYLQVADLVDGDFYRKDHALIWRAIQYMAEKDRPFDAVTIGEWFNARGAGEHVGHGAYLVELASTTPSAANVRAYADIIRDKALLRGLIDAGTQIVGGAFDTGGREPTEILAAGQALLGDLLKAKPCELESANIVLRRVMEELQARVVRGPGQIAGLSTGYGDLDELIHGMQEGDLIVLAGRPGMGKSTLALNIAEYVAVELGKRSAVHSLEMPTDSLMGRSVCSIGRIPHHNFERADLDEEEWARLTAAMRRLKDAPIVLSRPRSARAQQIVAQTQREHAENPLAVVMVDYAQLLDTLGAENKNVGIGEASRLLKLMAVNLGVAVVLISQLSRDCERRPNKRPIPSDLRDSGSLEQDADIILFVYRDELYNPNSPDKGTAEIIVGKNRRGKLGTARLASRLDICRFDNLSPDWTPAPAADDSARPSGPRRSGWRSRASSHTARTGTDD